LKEQAGREPLGTESRKFENVLRSSAARGDTA